MQFIPVVERLNADGLTLYQEGTTVSERSVLPEQFGRFLCAIFDGWMQHDVGSVFVQPFEATLRNWLGMPSSGICVFNETCGTGLAIEHNGDLYSCDHFIEPNFFLGNIVKEHMIELVVSSQQLKFGLDKRDNLPQYCLECEVRFACHRECPKNRFILTLNGEPGLNYLCAGLKEFSHHARFQMTIMAGLIRRGREAKEVMEILERAFRGVHHSAPCGSGRKFRQCHGKPAPSAGVGTLSPMQSRSMIHLDEKDILEPGLSAVLTMDD